MVGKAKQPAVWVRPGFETLVKFAGPWVPARQEGVTLVGDLQSQKGTPNLRFEVTFICDISSTGLEALKADDMHDYVRFLIDSSELGYDPLNWMKRRAELGLRYDVRYSAAYRPPKGKKWRLVDCEGLEFKVRRRVR